MTPLRFKAPGKLFLAGEYAVTLGCPALITAVPIWGFLEADSDASLDDIAAIYPCAPSAPLEQKGALDTTAFFDGDTKLGFGSSATAAVLLAKLANQQCSNSELWKTALLVHENLVGKGGSGGDLAAIIHGGTGLFHRQNDTYQWKPVIFPKSAELVVIQTQASANTRNWISRFNVAQKSDTFKRWFRQTQTCVEQFSDPTTNWQKNMQQAADLYSELKLWLGDDLYTPEFEICLELSKKLEIPFKPSGAGGGDIGFFYSHEEQCKDNLIPELTKLALKYRIQKPSMAGLHQIKS